MTSTIGLEVSKTPYDLQKFNDYTTNIETEATIKVLQFVFPRTHLKYTPYYRINNVESLKSKPLIDYGLTDKELGCLKNFYFKKKSTLNSLEFPKLLHHNGDKSGSLPCSVVLIPSKLKKRGIYALLKHREEVDNGTFNRIVYAIQLGNSITVKVFRSALREHVFPNERMANLKAIKYPKYFLAGNYVNYKGSYRKRYSNRIEEGLSRQEYQQKTIQEKNLKKTGIILDYANGGTLLQLIAKQKLTQDWTFIYQLSKRCAEALHILHEHLQMVHYDLKPENIFFHENDVKIGDFGFTLSIGAKRSGAGTRGYIAPEVIRSEIRGEDYFAHPAADVWALGCIFAEICDKSSWYKWCANMSYAEWSQMTQAELDVAKDLFFPNRNKIYHYDYIIDQCLQLNPKKRPFAYHIAQLCDL